MPLTVQSLGSGSSGNALLIDTGEAAVIVDCGLGPRALDAGLRAVGRRLSQIQAVLLTHEHADHIKGLTGAIKAGVPVVTTGGTARAVGVALPTWQEILPWRPLLFAGFTVTALAISHDAAEPCGFVVTGGGGTVTIVTDVGFPDPALRDPLAAADLIVLEANHDEAMLRRGPYPPHLKRRVLSRLGHLSNADCAGLLGESLAAGSASRTIWLAHLSQTNNRPELARQTVAGSLATRGQVHAVASLPRYGPGPVWSLAERPDVIVQLPMF